MGCKMSANSFHWRVGVQHVGKSAKQAKAERKLAEAAAAFYNSLSEGDQDLVDFIANSRYEDGYEAGYDHF